MTEQEFQEYKKRAIAKDVLSVENRIRHAFNQGVECGRRLSSSVDGDRAISRKHFENRVREAVGLVEEELSDDFKDGIMMTLELLKTEPPVTPYTGQMELGVKIALQGIKEKINNITSEMARKGVDTKYFEPIKAFVDDRLAECEINEKG